MNGSDHCRPKHLLLTHHEFLKEVDGDVVVRREEDANVAGEEVIDLALAPVLGCELLGRDLSHLALIILDLMHMLITLFH